MIKSQQNSGNLVGKPSAATKADKSSGHKKKPAVSNTHPNEFLTLQTSYPSQLYSGCQKNVPVFKRFFLQPYNRLCRTSVFRNIIMASGIRERI
jgi:hypothetical protein